MSLIDSRHECPRCGGYRTGFKTTLSSACRCPDYQPVEPRRHQIGGANYQPPRGQRLL